MTGRPRYSDSLHQSYMQMENSALVLAGFALTALTVLISVYSNNLARVNDMITFFSLSFVLLVVVSLLTYFRTHNLFSFLCYAFRYASVLAIGNGFLVFFLVEMPCAPLVAWIYVLFIIAFVGITLLDLYHYYLWWKESRR